VDSTKSKAKKMPALRSTVRVFQILEPGRPKKIRLILIPIGGKMDKKTCRNCNKPLSPFASWSYFGFCSRDCEEVAAALIVINQQPAKMRVAKAALLLMVLAVSAQARDYTAEARKLARISHRRARVEVIQKALRAVDLNARALPPGFDRRDMIALALTESALYHREVNTQCVGEIGLYQVRPEYFQRGDDGLQVSINTALAVRVLRSKHDTAKRLTRKRLTPYGLKKTTIICYNGFVRRGKSVDDRYYRAWSHNRRRVDLALGKTTPAIREIRITHKSRKMPVKIALIYPLKPTAAQLAEASYLEEMSAS